MKQQVLKALANPSHLFRVPYSLAVLNFAVLFLIYMTAFIVSLLADALHPVSPMYFIFGVLITHFLLMLLSKKDPQLGQIVVAKFNLLKRKIPRKLAA